MKNEIGYLVIALGQLLYLNFSSYVVWFSTLFRSINNVPFLKWDYKKKCILQLSVA